MSEAKHTPEPWHVGEPVHEYEAGHAWSVPVWANHAEPGDKIAAEAMAGDRDQARANARLIAAAPELLAELRACRDRLAELRDGEALIGAAAVVRALIQKRIEAADAAIAKAEGRD